VIKQCNSELQELLNLNCLTAALYREGLLTDQEQQEITNDAALPYKQNSHFVHKILPFKGEQSFKKFLALLENDNQHSGHKELFAILVQCYTGKCVQSSKSEREDDSERINVTKRQLKLILGELINDTVGEQLKEMVAIQKRHEVLLNLIMNNLNQRRNNDGLNPDDENHRRISYVSNTTNSSRNSAVGSSYSADCEGSDTLSIFSGDLSGLMMEDMKQQHSLYSPDDEHLVCKIKYHSLYGSSYHTKVMISFIKIIQLLTQ